MPDHLLLFAEHELSVPIRMGMESIFGFFDNLVRPASLILMYRLEPQTRLPRLCGFEGSIAKSGPCYGEAEDDYALIVGILVTGQGEGRVS